MPLLRKVPHVLALALIVSLSLAGCKKKEEEDNQQCESDCTSELAADIEDCENEKTACLSACAGPDDYECTWECDDYADDCMGSFYMCAGFCPCATEVRSCANDCDTSGEDYDIECLTDCTDLYMDCAGEDSPYMCATECLTASSICEYNCEQLSYSSSEFTTCREACSSEAADCLGACD
jgi:hypothetical protein